LSGLAGVEYSTGILSNLWSRVTKSSRVEEEEIGAQEVKIVIGLGNPGQKYESTRHNLGFMVIDELRNRLQPDVQRERFKSQLWEARHAGDRVVLAKPQTFMNLSGVAVQQIDQWYKPDMGNILVVYDELDLEFGSLRMRERGSAGGHNGLASILQSLGTTDVPRLRIGIGRGKSAAKARVLSTFTPEERESLPAIVERAADGVMRWIDQGPIAAMNAINVREASQTPEPAGVAPVEQSE
jgi:PTH1 family peptidyl-tRNA hydrolase